MVMCRFNLTVYGKQFNLLYYIKTVQKDNLFVYING